MRNHAARHASSVDTFKSDVFKLRAMRNHAARHASSVDTFRSDVLTTRCVFLPLSSYVDVPRATQTEVFSWAHQPDKMADQRAIMPDSARFQRPAAASPPPRQHVGKSYSTSETPARVHDEMECRSPILDLRPRQQLTIHRTNQISPCENQRSPSILLDEPPLEFRQRHPELISSSVPDCRDVDLAVESPLAPHLLSGPAHNSYWIFRWLRWGWRGCLYRRRSASTSHLATAMMIAMAIKKVIELSVHISLRHFAESVQPQVLLVKSGLILTVLI